MVAALGALRVDPEDLERAAPITSVLEQAAGGLKAVLEAMRFSQDPTIAEFLAAYDKASEGQQKILPWEAFALSAKLDPTALLGAVMLCIREHSVNIVKVLAISSHPDTMRARIRAAKTLGGVRDRNALDTGLGFLQPPKGVTIINRLPNGDGPTEELEGEADVDFLFPSLLETQKKLAAPRKE